MPSAIFSTSFARSLLIDIVDKPDGSVVENLSTSLPPCGLETPVS